MSLNCNEINLILSELDMNGSFIQEITQPGYDSLVFRLIKGGQNYSILICTASSSCRLHLIPYNKVPKNPKPLRFNEFLKSRVQGMRINECRQLGLERIIRMDVSTWKERLFVYIRLWSGAANVIVTDEAGNILDCMFRRPKKGEVSGGTFFPPEQVLSEEEILEKQKKFPIRHFENPEENAQKEDALFFNKKICEFYTEHAVTLSRESLLLQADKWYNSKKSKMDAALARLLEKQAEFENCETLRHTGDLILANAHLAENSFLDCEDYETGKTVHIRLDSKLSPQENACAYYEKYKKAVSGKEALAHDIALSKKAIEELNAQYTAIKNEQNVLKMEQLLRKDSTPKQQTEKQHPGLSYLVDGWTIFVGRTAQENDELLRHFVKGQDVWLHTRDYAGGYVFVKGQKGKTVPLDILLYAGNLAVYHSKARKNAEADLYYTQVKYLRRAKNGPKGLVLPTQEKNLHIKLDTERLNRLDELERL